MKKGTIRAASTYDDYVTVEMDDGSTRELREGDQVVLDNMAFKPDSTLEKDGGQWLLRNCQGGTYLQGPPVTVYLD